MEPAGRGHVHAAEARQPPLNAGHDPADSGVGVQDAGLKTYLRTLDIRFTGRR
jgi:hypothetical protein